MEEQEVISEDFLNEHTSHGMRMAREQILQAAENIVSSRILGQPLPNEAELLLAKLEPLEQEHRFLDWEDTL